MNSEESARTASLNLSTLPTYGFQFALSNLGKLFPEFLKITLVSVIGGLLGFFGTYLLAELISEVNRISYESLGYYYIPAFLLAYLFKEGLEYLTRRNGETFPTVAASYFSQRFFKSILESEPHILANINREELLVACSRYLGRASGFLSDWIWNTSRKFIQFVLIIIILAWQSWWVCAAALAYMLFFLFFALKLSNYFAPFAQRAAESSQKAGTQLTQSFLASPTIRRLGLEDFFLGKLGLAFNEQIAAVQGAQCFHAKRWLIQLNAFNILYIGTLFYGIYQVKAGSLELGFLLLIRYAFERLWEIMVFVIEKYVALLQEKEESNIFKRLLKPLLGQEQSKDSKEKLSDFSQMTVTEFSITFQDGKRAEKFVLQCDHLSIEKGKYYSLSAPSGSGKTSFMLALMKLVPYQGEIFVDGKSLRQFNLSQGFATYVSSADPLFPFSILENITLGRKHEANDLEELLTGLGINEFVKDSSVALGTATTHLSLGQAQRIRLARALLKPSALLLLDEPFTALDAGSRDKVKDFILQRAKDCCIILASHVATDMLPSSEVLLIQERCLIQA